MFQEDLKKNQQDRRFAESEHNGFNVLDFVAFDEALQHLERTTKTHLSQRAQIITRPLLPLIEFSRNDYRRAFQQFSPEFLQNTCFVYLDTTLENCKQRIRERIEKPGAEKNEDDYYVSDYIFETYYSHGENISLVQILERFGINKEKVLIVNNNVQPARVSQEIQIFVYDLIKKYPSGSFSPDSHIKVRNDLSELVGCDWAGISDQSCPLEQDK